MKVRIPLARGEDGAAEDEHGHISFVIIETNHIVLVIRVDDMLGIPKRKHTKTVIGFAGGEERISFNDEDLCVGWSHEHVLRVLGWDVPEAAAQPADGALTTILKNQGPKR